MRNAKPPGNEGIFTHKRYEYDPSRDGRIEVEGTREVIRALIKQAQAVREGREDPNIKIVLFIESGGMQGAAAAGLVTALQEAGLVDGLSLVVASSTGAPTAAYMLAGNPREGAEIYRTYCCTDGFINFRRLEEPMSTHFLSQVYTGEVGDIPLDTEAVKNSKPRYEIVATNGLTAGVEVLDGKIKTIDRIQGSCSMPGLSTFDRVYSDDGETFYVDGAIAGIPYDEIIEREKPSHVFIFANCPKDEKPKLQLPEMVLAATFSEPLRKAYESSKQRKAKSYEKLASSGTPHLIFYTDHSVGPLTTEQARVASATQRHREFFSEMIREEMENSAS